MFFLFVSENSLLLCFCNGILASTEAPTLCCTLESKCFPALYQKASLWLILSPLWSSPARCAAPVWKSPPRWSFVWAARSRPRPCCVCPPRSPARCASAPTRLWPPEIRQIQEQAHAVQTTDKKIRVPLRHTMHHLYINMGSHLNTNAHTVSSISIKPATQFLFFWLCTPPQWIWNKTISMSLQCRLSALIWRLICLLVPWNVESTHKNGCNSRTVHPILAVNTLKLKLMICTESSY